MYCLNLKVEIESICFFLFAIKKGGITEAREGQYRSAKEKYKLQRKIRSNPPLHLLIHAETVYAARHYNNNNLNYSHTPPNRAAITSVTRNLQFGQSTATPSEAPIDSIAMKSKSVALPQSTALRCSSLTIQANNPELTITSRAASSPTTSIPGCH
ncbi:unnamed protein product [Vicia faba]|uniref:Uncharacterized protein n=1 Tax=Vicia faba TaxID=3906 RepID=A0AAV1AKH6_VICFA|nr:unnamed protein product [Vicia faba]